MPRSRTTMTLKDVAQLAECSTSVVSTVINGAKGNTLVSDTLRKRVQTAATELGYRPNFASQSLVSRRTRTLGLYIPPNPWSGAGFPYEGEILKGIEDACREQEYDLLLINLAGNRSPGVCLDKFNERRFDGILLIHANANAAWIRQLNSARCNVVAIDYTGPETDVSAVRFDNGAASRMAIDHLVGLGHQRIGFIGTCRTPSNTAGLARADAFIAHLRDRGLPFESDWVFDLHNAPRPLRKDEDVCQREGLWAAGHIASLGPAGPTAWIAYSDLVATSALPHLQAAGLRVPQDLSLIGVDDSLAARTTTPP